MLVFVRIYELQTNKKLIYEKDEANEIENLFSCSIVRLFFWFLFFVYRVVNIIIVSYFKFEFRSTNRFSCMNANWESSFGRDENLTTIDQYCIVKNNIYVTFNIQHST